MSESDATKISIIKLIIGDTEGHGESRTDKISLGNIPLAHEAVVGILEPLVKNASYTGDEGSRITLKNKSVDALRDIAGYIVDCLGREDDHG